MSTESETESDSPQTQTEDRPRDAPIDAEAGASESSWESGLALTATPQTAEDAETAANAEAPTAPAHPRAIPLERVDADAVKVVQRLRRYNHIAYLVGGCVRDLLLGLKPKDFDVVTSATPPEIKRLFRNCRIIGRRFRLAHVFFGPKIIETSTFRANPREVEEEENEGSAAENGDLLIRRDNVFGTPEEDARRRDFTINGLFYDVEKGEVIDHVGGRADLEARLVRTIGDPDIRFREDPVRILRAIKFAARCGLRIETETYRRLLDHRREIEKCPPARVSEEFFRLLRAGAAKRSMELLVETEILDLMAPDLARGLRGETPSVSAEEGAVRSGRFWRYLEALDRSTERRPTAPSNSLIMATLLLPPLRDVLDPDTNVRDVGSLVAATIQPAVEQLKVSRRDAELTRQILLALRYILPSKAPRRRRPRLAGREFFDDALRLAEMVSEVEASHGDVCGRPVVVEGGLSAEEALPEDDSPPELESTLDDRRGRGRDRERAAQAPVHAAARGREGRPVPSAGGSTGQPGRSSREAFGVQGGPSVAELERWLAGALQAEPARPAFLGTGAFGGPWNAGASD
jgi:poly(A) polymerase